jgi:hypothetical protein
VLQYRVTKYDPTLRDSEGSYTRDEWRSASDVGRSFGGVVLSREAYQHVEDAYVAVAQSFLQEAGLSSLVVAGLENRRARVLTFGEGSTLSLEQVAEVTRRLLQEDFWCRLEGTTGFLHVGWDYYMYLGVPGPCPKSHELARRSGLFVEDYPSPYSETNRAG